MNPIYLDQSMISFADYRDQCHRFFDERGWTAQEIDQQVAHLSVQDFEAWRQNLYADYNAAVSGVVRALVAKMNLDEEMESETTKAQRAEVRQYREVNEAVLNERVFSLACVQTQCELQCAWHAQKAHEQRLRVTVDGREFVAEKVIDVLWCGWESDNSAWLVRDNGVARLVTTGHGQTCFDDKAFLEARIAEYKAAIEQTQQMLDALNT